MVATGVVGAGPVVVERVVGAGLVVTQGPTLIKAALGFREASVPVVYCCLLTWITHNYYKTLRREVTGLC